MDARGLYIAGLDANGISSKLETYIADYIKGYKLGTGQSILVEGHIFYFSEVKHMVRTKHHHLFTDDEKFLGMSGYIATGNKHGEANQLIVMVLLDELSKYAYSLCVQDADEDGAERIIIIKDFLS